MTRYRPSRRRALAAALLSAGLGACAFPEVLAPEFERETGAIVADLKALHGFEDAGIRWRAFGSGEEATHTLVVQLLNGTDLPTGEPELRAVGARALRLVTESIANEAAYDGFEAQFTRRKQAGPVRSDSSFSFAYELSELE